MSRALMDRPCRSRGHRCDHWGAPAQIARVARGGAGQPSRTAPECDRWCLLAALPAAIGTTPACRPQSVRLAAKPREPNRYGREVGLAAAARSFVQAADYNA